MKLVTGLAAICACAFAQSADYGYIADNSIRQIDFPSALINSLNEFTLTFTMRTSAACDTTTNSVNVLKWAGFGIGCTHATWGQLVLWPGVNGHGPVALASNTSADTVYKFVLQRSPSTVEARVFSADGQVIATKSLAAPAWTRVSGVQDVIRGGSAGTGQKGNVFYDMCWYPSRLTADIANAQVPPSNQCRPDAIGKWLFDGNLQDTSGANALHFRTTAVTPQFTGAAQSNTPSGTPRGYVADSTPRQINFPSTVLSSVNEFAVTFTMRTDDLCETTTNAVNVFKWVGFGIGCTNSAWRQMVLWPGVNGFGPVVLADNTAPNTDYRFLLQRTAKTLDAKMFRLDGTVVASRSLVVPDWTRTSGWQEVIRGGPAGVGQQGNSFHNICWYPFRLAPDINTATMPQGDACSSGAIGQWLFDSDLKDTAGIYNLDFSASGPAPRFVSSSIQLAPPAIVAPASNVVTVNPAVSDAVLYNPGMGFAAFHPGPNALPSFSTYPTTRVAYYRWYWYELEPVQGQINFKLLDDAIAYARANNQDVAFRIMPAIPSWLAAQGVGTVGTGSESLPDHNNPSFLSNHERLVAAIGERYSGSIDIDHVDMGSVGCWGEGNTSCCPAGTRAKCDSYMPTPANSTAIAGWYYRYFRGLPLVALAGQTQYATGMNAGWRGDCFGDYGMFSSQWNHMMTIYPPIIQRPEVANAWQSAPVEFEACGVMQQWYDRGFSIDLILQRGLEWHTSVFNGKNAAVPPAWRPKVDAWLKKIGYRFVLKSLTHLNNVAAGATVSLQATWENRGVSPAYRPWPVAFRLRSADGSVAAQWQSSADVRKWLPGSTGVTDTVRVPPATPPGDYALDVAILRENGQFAYVELANTGKRTDLWYSVSQVRVLSPAP